MPRCPAGGRGGPARGRDGQLPQQRRHLRRLRRRARVRRRARRDRRPGVVGPRGPRQGRGRPVRRRGVRGAGPGLLPRGEDRRARRGAAPAHGPRDGPCGQGHPGRGTVPVGARRRERQRGGCRRVLHGWLARAVGGRARRRGEGRRRVLPRHPVGEDVAVLGHLHRQVRDDPRLRGGRHLARRGRPGGGAGHPGGGRRRRGLRLPRLEARLLQRPAPRGARPGAQRALLASHRRPAVSRL